MGAGKIGRVEYRDLRKLRLELERRQQAAAFRMQETEAWKEYQRAGAEAFARFDAAVAALEKEVRG